MDIMDIITSLGFPVACVVSCAWFIYTMYKNEVKDKERLYEQLATSNINNANMANVLAKTTVVLDAISIDIKNMQNDIQSIKDNKYN